MTNQEIKAELAARNWTQKQLADAIGIDQNYVTKSLSPTGKRQWKSHEMEAIHRVFGRDEARRVGAREIPVIGLIAAGNWREAVQNTRATMPTIDPDAPPRAFYLEIVGDSMDLVVADGARVLVDPDDRTLYPGRYYVVQNAEGETTFKQVKTDPLRLVPCSSNPAHTEIIIGEEQFSIVGRVRSYGGML